ncbi:MAG: hypothetical protein AB7G15_08505 [Alphaproteobacteria bacterium]
MPIVPLLFCVDVEPDLRQPDPALPVDWVGWHLAQSASTEWRRNFAAATGRAVHFGWYLRMDPQIEMLHGDAAYLATRDRTFLDACHAVGDEIGVHNHAHRWDAAARRWVIDHGDDAWLDHVVELGCAAYARAFARRLRSFRFGDGFMSNRVMTRLAQLGVRYDLTLEPGMPGMAGYHATEMSRGALPDRASVSRVPYRPAAQDYRQAARFRQRRLWSIPVSTAPPPNGAWPGYAYVPMNLAHPPRPTATMFDWLLAEREAPYAVLALRAGDLAQPALAASFQANMTMLRAHPRAADFAFVTPSAFVRWYRRFGRARA